MGYTSKLAGTETGVAEPGSTFSRFFGAPFMPRLPHAYTDLLGEYLDRYKTRTWLVNTGWSGAVRGRVADRHPPHPGDGAGRVVRRARPGEVHPR